MTDSSRCRLQLIAALFHRRYGVSTCSPALVAWSTGSRAPARHDERAPGRRARPRFSLRWRGPDPGAMAPLEDYSPRSLGLELANRPDSVRGGDCWRAL